MVIANDVSAAVGNTPLIRLRRASEETGCAILGKAEFMNPGQSVKDRAALFIIRDALEKGTLRPGGTIVEGTAGNTGIGLTVIGRAMGFKTVIVIPETQSQEKKDMLRLCGADLREVPAVPYKNPENYVHVSRRLAPDGLYVTWVDGRIGDAKTRAIAAALVNPAGHDPGLERVLLLNTLATAVNLDGWALADKNKRRHPLDGIALEAGAMTALTLPGSTIQLSNQGGIITLLNSDGLKVHGVQCNKKDVSEQGRIIVFY